MIDRSPGRIVRALFSVEGAGLPPEVVLLARVVATAWLVTGHALYVPERAAPFFDVLIPIAGSPIFPWTVLLLDVALTLHLVAGRSVRAASLSLGLLIFATTLLSRTYFSNNRLFCGCLFVLCGLERAEGPPLLLRAQVVLLYLAAGLDKLLDADWRSGAFLGSFTGRLASFGRLWSPAGDAGAPNLPATLYVALDRLLAPPALSPAVSWAVIAAELGIAAALLLGRARAGVILGLGFHAGLVVLTGSPMGMFYYAATAAFLAFGRFPRRIEVSVDPRRGVHVLAREIIGGLDADGRFVFDQNAEGGLRAGAGGASRTGAGAWLALAVHSPAVYSALAVLLAGPWFRAWLVLLLLPPALMFRPFRAPTRSAT